MASANRYLEQVYRTGHNREFGVPSTLQGTAEEEEDQESVIAAICWACVTSSSPS